MRLHESDAEFVRKRLAECWGYDDSDYWDPLVQRSPRETIFFPSETLFRYEADLVRLVQERERFVYFFGEVGSLQYPSSILKTVFATESIVTGLQFDWVTYLSHEGTIAIGGEWLIKEIVSRMSAVDLELKNQWSRPQHNQRNCENSTYWQRLFKRKPK